MGLNLNAFSVAGFLLISYLLTIIFHHALQFWFYMSKRGRFGSRLVLKEHKLAFHLILNDADNERLKELPIVIFESHLGHPATVWGYVQRHLQGKLPTLSYQRTGYGWSSDLDYEKKRTAENSAMELRILLEELSLDKRPAIIVGHSYGGVKLVKQ